MMKKDIVKMIECEGSQTGKHIKEDVKKCLVQGAGWKPDCNSRGYVSSLLAINGAISRQWSGGWLLEDQIPSMVWVWSHHTME